MAPDIRWEIAADGCAITLAATGRTVKLAWRSDAAAQDVADARTLHHRRLQLHNTLAAGLRAIESGKAPEDAAERLRMYADEREKASLSVWDSCMLMIELLLAVPPEANLRAAIPASSDGLWKFSAELYARAGLSPDERDNLKRGALEEWGVLSPEPDGTIRTCACAELHRYGRCPNWPPFAWEPKAKRVWNDWRAAAIGGTPTVDLAYIDGAAILSRLRAELDAEAACRAFEDALKNKEGAEWPEKP